MLLGGEAREAGPARRLLHLISFIYLEELTILGTSDKVVE